MICAEESASTDRQRLLDPTRPMREPVRYRTVAGAARVVRGRARNRHSLSYSAHERPARRRISDISQPRWVSLCNFSRKMRCDSKLRGYDSEVYQNGARTTDRPVQVPCVHKIALACTKSKSARAVRRALLRRVGVPM